ncbi:MAG: threonylcarbamoyl-AMP synthase [Clostridia bacterium]|nr:threonylcarbamoyl-AMP synthase [Clostridia bacterium]
MSKFYNWKNGINEEELTDVVNTLNNDGIVIFPTETVYGIAGSSMSEVAIDKIYKAKNRPREKAINIMLADKKDINKYAVVKSKMEQNIIDTYMPGPITLILEKKEDFGKSFTLSNNTIGIRIPDNEIAQAILKRLDYPIIAPSANISGKESGVDANEIKEDFYNTVDIIIDGGRIENAEASTIIKVENEQIVVLRQGKVKF